MDEHSPAVRVSTLELFLLMALAIPEAFGD
jgi:hypothetical protein